MSVEGDQIIFAYFAYYVGQEGGSGDKIITIYSKRFFTICLSQIIDLIPKQFLKKWTRGQNQKHFRASLELVHGKTQSWGGTSLLLKTGLKPV